MNSDLDKSSGSGNSERFNDKHSPDAVLSDSSSSNSSTTPLLNTTGTVLCQTDAPHDLKVVSWYGNRDF